MEFENISGVDEIDRELSSLLQELRSAVGDLRRNINNTRSTQIENTEQRVQRQAYNEVRRQETQYRRETGFSRSTILEANNGDEEASQRMTDTLSAKKRERELARLNRTLGIDDSSMKRADAKQKAVSAETKELQNMGAMLGKVTRLLQIFGIALGLKAWADRPKKDTESYTSAFQAGLSLTRRRVYELTAEQIGVNKGTFVSGQRVVNDLYARLKQGQYDERYAKLLAFGQQYGLKLPQIQDVNKMTPQEFFMNIVGGFEKALKKGMKEDDINSVRTLFNDFFGSDDISSAIGIAFQNGFSVIERILDNQSVIENPYDYSKTMLDFNKEWEEFKARVLNQLMEVATKLAEFAMPLVDFLNRMTLFANNSEKDDDLKGALSAYETIMDNKAKGKIALTPKEEEKYYNNFLTSIKEGYLNLKIFPDSRAIEVLIGKYTQAKLEGNVDRQKNIQKALQIFKDNEWRLGWASKLELNKGAYLAAPAIDIEKALGVSKKDATHKLNINDLWEMILADEIKDATNGKNLYFNDDANEANSAKQSKKGETSFIQNSNKDGIQIIPTQSNLNLDKLQVNENPNLALLSNSNNEALLAQVDVLLNINNNSNDILEYDVTSKSDSINAVTINEGYGYYG